MTDKQLMSREEIEKFFRVNEFRCDRVEWLCDTALAAHDMYDKAIEDAAQKCEQLDSQRGGDIAHVVRRLKGTSHG